MKPAKPKNLQENLNNDSHYSFRVKDVTKEYYKKLWSPPADNDADTILQWLYDRGLVQNYIKKLEYDTIDDETVQDEIQEVWLILVEKKDYLKNLYDTQGITGLTATVAGIIHRQIHSNSSHIYKKYKQGYKTMKHISEQTWDVFDNTGKMISTDTDYLNTEDNTDLIIKHIENNDMDKLSDLLYNEKTTNKNK